MNLGTLLFGITSDYLGRKPISVFVLTFGNAMIVGSAMAPNWHILLVGKFSTKKN